MGRNVNAGALVLIFNSIYGLMKYKRDGGGRHNVTNDKVETDMKIDEQRR